LFFNFLLGVLTKSNNGLNNYELYDDESNFDHINKSSKLNEYSNYNKSTQSDADELIGIIVIN
jgi:hypothetical protein